jgi:hypothetical protein
MVAAAPRPLVAIGVNSPSSRKNILEEAAFHRITASWVKSADSGGSALPSFLLFKIFILLSRPFA